MYIFKLEVRDGGSIYLDVELEVSSFKAFNWFQRNELCKGRRSTRILSNDGRFNVQCWTCNVQRFELNVIKPLSVLNYLPCTI